MNCRSCKKEIPDGSAFCCYCGRKQTKKENVKRRGNGTGSVVALPNGKYKAVVILRSYTDDEGKLHRKIATQVFSKKVDARNALPELRKRGEKSKLPEFTFKQVYDKWLPTHRAGKDTMNCYKAAVKYFEPLFYEKIKEIEVDDLQECMDLCPHGKRTRQNMKAVCGLIYKYGIPRHYVPEKVNLSEYLIVTGEDGIERESFTETQLKAIRNQIGVTFGAEYIYCLCYLGFRPSEFLSLKCTEYDIENQRIIGGAKTEAGKHRSVTISPKIQQYISDMASKGNEYLVTNPEGKPYTKDNFPEMMYKVLQAAGIDNPMIESAGRMVHKYTPHSCRHTFASLMMRVRGSDKSKQKLIGHSSSEMLRYYQGVDLDDLKMITDAI